MKKNYLTPITHHVLLKGEVLMIREGSNEGFANPNNPGKFSTWGAPQRMTTLYI